jgi:23S rRNA pseudouridine2604 synthase
MSNTSISYLFSRNKKIGSRLISWASGLLVKDLRKVPSHMAVLVEMDSLPEGLVIESVFDAGVRIVPYKSWLRLNELCYKVVFGADLYNCAYCDHCFNSKDCFFSLNLRGCDHCVFCSNLNNKQYFAYNKPRGIVTHKTEDDQKEILETITLPKDVFPVGRLDRQSHGLILLTNDGRVNDKLLNPDHDHEKEYLVRVAKPITNIFLKILTNGVQLEDFKTKPCKVKKVSDYEFKIILTEGKKHQIRRMCVALFQEVDTLKRVRIMNIILGKVEEGSYRKIVGEELNVFLKDLGLIQ